METIAARFAPVVYAELKRLAAGHLRGQWNITLSATGLVHEAFLRVSAVDEARIENRAHFFGIASRAMRNVLVDLLRQANAQKRGGAAITVRLDEAMEIGDARYTDVLLLDQALSKLAREHDRPAQAIEMKYFGGMTALEIAAALAVSDATVKRDLRFAQAWLRRELNAAVSGGQNQAACSGLKNSAAR